MANKVIDRKTIKQWVDPHHRHNVFDHWAVERFEYVYKINNAPHFNLRRYWQQSWTHRVLYLATVCARQGILPKEISKYKDVITMQWALKNCHASENTVRLVVRDGFDRGDFIRVTREGISSKTVCFIASDKLVASTSTKCEPM